MCGKGRQRRIEVWLEAGEGDASISLSSEARGSESGVALVAHGRPFRMVILAQECI